ncbi:unnamed protein product, partial [marine sediment metagenome]
RAFELANITMNILLDKLWDNTYGGFENYRYKIWDDGDAGHDYKYLQTNALGIITLLEYWKETGMQTDSAYFQNATYLYGKLELLWNTTHQAYEKNGGINWGISGADDSIGLEANSIMMSACLKLFEYTGNITFYNRAWQLFIGKEQEYNFEDYNEICDSKLPLLDWHTQEKNILVPHQISLKQAIETNILKKPAFAYCLFLGYYLTTKLGFPEEVIRLRQHAPQEMAHYADDAWDLEINTKQFGWVEICGIHDRTDYDLKR